jgi:hypothetical protein
MKLRIQALAMALLLVAFMVVAQPALALTSHSTSGGTGFGRWVLFQPVAGNIELNMSVPEEITNETDYTFHGNAIHNTTGTSTIYVSIDINGTWAYSGAVTVPANNTTKDVPVTFAADRLSQGDDQNISIYLKVGDNVTIDAFWVGGTINITTQFAVLTDWIISTVLAIVTVMLVFVVVGMIVRVMKRTGK